MFGKPKPCGVPGCGSKYHQTWQHPKPMVQRSPLKSSGRLRQESPKTKAKREEVSALWYELNPPNEMGYWYCYLRISPDCLMQLDRSTVRLEHVFSKARRRDLKFNVKNLRPACDPCNKLKGSLNANEILSDEAYAALNMEVS